MTEHQSRPGEAKRYYGACSVLRGAFMEEVSPERFTEEGHYVKAQDHAAWVAYATRLEAEIAALKRGSR